MQSLDFDDLFRKWLHNHSERHAQATEWTTPVALEIEESAPEETACTMAVDLLWRPTPMYKMKDTSPDQIDANTRLKTWSHSEQLHVGRHGVTQSVNLYHLLCKIQLSSDKRNQKNMTAD